MKEFLKILFLVTLFNFYLSSSIDISSFANIEQLKQSHITFEMNINFDDKM